MSVKFTLLLIIDAQLIFLAFIPPGLAATSKFLLLYTLIFFVHFAYSHKLYWPTFKVWWCAMQAYII